MHKVCTMYTKHPQWELNFTEFADTDILLYIVNKSMGRDDNGNKTHCMCGRSLFSVEIEFWFFINVIGKNDENNEKKN